MTPMTLTTLSSKDPHPSPGFDGDAATGLSLEDATVYLETGGEEHSFARWMAACACLLIGPPPPV